MGVLNWPWVRKVTFLGSILKELPRHSPSISEFLSTSCKQCFWPSSTQPSHCGQSQGHMGGEYCFRCHIISLPGKANTCHGYVLIGQKYIKANYRFTFFLYHCQVYPASEMIFWLYYFFSYTRWLLFFFFFYHFRLSIIFCESVSKKVSLIFNMLYLVDLTIKMLILK